MIEPFKILAARIRLVVFCLHNLNYRIAEYRDSKNRICALSAYGGREYAEIIFYKRPGHWVGARCTHWV